MNRDIFIETLEQLKKQTEYDMIVASHLSKAFPNAFEANLLPDNSFLYDQLIKILQIETGDYQDGHSWIAYFIYDLEYGGKYHDGCAKRKDGSFIDLSNAGSLYDFLME